MKSEHRNSQKRIYLPGYIYFIVVKTHNNYPYFKESIFCDLFIENLKICKRLKGFNLYGFSLIYDHVNLLIKPNAQYNISQILKSLKENVSRDINVTMGYTSHASDTSTRRLHMREVLLPALIKKYKQKNAVYHKFRWLKSFHDHYIRNEDDYHNHYDYTVFNHLKHGLPEQWQYTSLHYPEMIDYPDF